MNDMNERVALVTGGTRGIGAAISTRLAQHGAKVAAVYNRDTQAADAFAKEASNNGLSVSLHQANVGNPGDCQRVVHEILRQYGRIDYLVNNAGAVHDRTALKMSSLDWEQVIRVNLSGPFYMSQAVLPHFLERGFGRIVMISSILGRVAVPWRGAYNASKFALEGLTDTLRLELRGSGIHVSLVNPGPVKSRFRDNSLANFDAWLDTAGSPHREKYAALRAETGTQKDDQPFTVGPEVVARKIAHALESRGPRARYYVTLPAYVLATARCLLPVGWLDALLSRI